MIDFFKTLISKEFLGLSIYRKFYISSLVLLVLGLPISPALVSMSQFLLLGTWLFEREFRAKFNALLSNRIAQLFLILPVLHLIWLANTVDFGYAFHDIKIKLPLILFPLILGSIKPLNRIEVKWILHALVIGTLLGTIASFIKVFIQSDVFYIDNRSVSVFISHIRFGLMVLFSILIIVYYSFADIKKYSAKKIIGLSLLLLWFLYFLVIIQSLTSWVALCAIIIAAFVKYKNNISLRKARIILSSSIIIFFLATFLLVAKVGFDFYFKPTFDLNNLPKNTQCGNPYNNQQNPVFKENGHYINILISDKELKETWSELSSLPYTGKTINGHSLKSTLIRYLTSKGLTKDRTGLLALEVNDIKLIEEGIACCVYGYKFVPYAKIYDVIWEIDRYVKTGNASNLSVVQRVEFAHAAFYIIKNNFWFGVGSGDLNSAYEDAYLKIDSNMVQTKRLRAHNQYLTFFVMFGVLGFVLSMISLFLPAFKSFNRGGFLYFCFLIMMFISMLNEDTLETQAGVTFFIVFYTIFAFLNRDQNIEELN